MIKKILLTGATGSIGCKIVTELLKRGDDVTVFTRNKITAAQKLPNSINIIKWDYSSVDEWKDHLNGIDTIVHLAGANLAAKRWNEKYKKIAYESRVISTRNLVRAIEEAEQKPKAIICSSAVGIYGNRGDNFLTEDEKPAENFLAKLCDDWEKEAAIVEHLGVRRVSVRTGLVLSKDEGLLREMLPSFKLFLGGYLGNGKQWFPWIHIDDIVGIYLHAIDNENLEGAVNAASPGIARMKEFAKTLGKVLNRPALFPIPKAAVKILKGELGNYVTDSQRIVVNKLIDNGFKFKFDNLEDALRDLLG